MISGQRLHQDQKGLVMPIGLLFLWWGILILASIANLGQYILQRQHHQTSSDLSAKTAAMLIAEDLNTVALSNLAIESLHALSVSVDLDTLKTQRQAAQILEMLAREAQESAVPQAITVAQRLAEANGIDEMVVVPLVSSLPVHQGQLGDTESCRCESRCSKVYMLSGLRRDSCNYELAVSQRTIHSFSISLLPSSSRILNSIFGHVDDSIIFSVARAEYYSPTNDLWHANWKARLVRFKEDSVFMMAKQAVPGGMSTQMYKYINQLGSMQ